ncbi:hypothetical protein D3C84_690480 [compost metagenome]
MLIMIVYEVANSRISEVKPFDIDLVVADIEEVIAEFQLNITQKTTLSTMKGSIHYHLKQGKASGVLEVTYWPNKSRLLVEIHHNRLQQWNQSIIGPFSEALADRFLGVVVPSHPVY